ncbi:hypothetical protein TNCV_1217681 [Trichonephila clavipes]|nr:hypothetical protein TNCV_1217681 [Trichonephila clavipes]
MDEYGQSPCRIQTAPGSTRPMNCRAFQRDYDAPDIFFFSLPSRHGQPFVNQESVNQESVKCRLNGRRVCLNFELKSQKKIFGL